MSLCRVPGHSFSALVGHVGGRRGRLYVWDPPRVSFQVSGTAQGPPALRDHGPCWVLYGVGRGEIEITTYRRTDDGRVPGKAIRADAL